VIITIVRGPPIPAWSCPDTQVTELSRQAGIVGAVRCLENIPITKFQPFSPIGFVFASDLAGEHQDQDGG
jgi:hypothetical protein